MSWIQHMAQLLIPAKSAVSVADSSLASRRHGQSRRTLGIGSGPATGPLGQPRQGARVCHSVAHRLAVQHRQGAGKTGRANHPGQGRQAEASPTAAGCQWPNARLASPLTDCSLQTSSGIFQGPMAGPASVYRGCGVSSGDGRSGGQERSKRKLGPRLPLKAEFVGKIVKSV